MCLTVSAVSIVQKKSNEIREDNGKLPAIIWAIDHFDSMVLAKVSRVCLACQMGPDKNPVSTDETRVSWSILFLDL
jgi:hypothetical protein